MSAVLALAIAQALSAVPGVPPVVVNAIDGKPLEGGPYEGLSLGIASPPTGRTFHGLLPSKPGSSTVRNQRDRAAVEAFIAGHENPDQEPLTGFLTKKSVFIICHQIRSCNRTPPIRIHFGETVTANEPYQRSGDRVRVEWLYGSALYYLSEIELRDGKIVSVITEPAWPPYQLRNKP